MGKFEVEFEITGLKLKVKGERADIPMIARNVGNQVANLLQPAADIIEGKTRPQFALPAIDATASDVPAPAGEKKRRRKAAGRSAARNAAKSSDTSFNADPATFGVPQQTWSTTDKSIWLLFTAAEGGGPKEMVGNKIATVFSSRFREAGKILRQNVNRDLLTVGTGNEALVNRNEDKSWFLTERGKKRAKELIAQAQQGAQTAN